MINKITLITGASSGIGMELAYVFAEQGHHLLLLARSENKLQEIKKSIEEKHSVNVQILAKDLCESTAPAEVLRYCKDKNLQVEYLVNNAGFGDFGFFHESAWQKQFEMIQLNITALTQLTHLFLPEMLERKSGKILQVASIASFLPGPLMSVYYATKAYVLHFSEALSNELNGTGVSITVLCPGPTESGFQEAANMSESRLVKNRKLPSSAEVAQYAYKAMMNEKRVAIHGFMNYLMANSVRFYPRSMVLKVARMIQDKK
jgi:short-subunit dehydrogenase